MRANVIYALVVLGWLVLPASGELLIDVSIDPPAPTIADPIVIHVSGQAPSGPVEELAAQFAKLDHELRLDLSMRLGFLTVITPWSWSEPIGMLPAGDYELVTSVDAGDPGYNPTARTKFTVVPEPGGGG